MEYSFVNIKDFYTLCRFVTDLGVYGLVNYKSVFNNSDDVIRFNWVAIYGDLTFAIYSHNGCVNPRRLTITEDNYNDILFSILNQLPCK